MAFQNFVPAQFAAGIERELEKLHVYVEDTNRKYEGEIKEKGDQVKILGIGKVSVKDIPSNGVLDDPQEIEDESQFLKITEQKYFNYKIGDIDKEFARADGIDAAVRSETTEALADVQDQFVADLIKGADAGVKIFYKTGTTGYTIGTTDKATKVIDDIVEYLRENNVKPSTMIVATVTPKFYRRIKDDLVDKDTDNSKLLKNGYVGMYNGVHIRVSNNKATSGSNHLIHVKTQRAFAFAAKATHVEAYRQEKGFADAVKGYILYGGKVTRPKEAAAIAVAAYD